MHGWVKKGKLIKNRKKSAWKFPTSLTTVFLRKVDVEKEDPPVTEEPDDDDDKTPPVVKDPGKDTGKDPTKGSDTTKKPTPKPTPRRIKITKNRNK